MKRSFSRSLDVLQDESFMTKYYDNTIVPKESELDTDELRTRLESWFCVSLRKLHDRASYRMFSGVKMRRNGDWYAFYKSTVEGN